MKTEKEKFYILSRYFILQKKEVCAQLFALEKRFKICYVYVKRKSKYFFHFSFRATFSFTLINAPVYIDIEPHRTGHYKGKTQSYSK